jgi:MerR family transcriptional regulator, thiopeptide resistance regulator
VSHELDPHVTSGRSLWSSFTLMAYTVKQLSELAGVSVRTLHHYDEIGLLIPSTIGANGYRYYDERSVLRLQSILFYRELDFPLEQIKAIVDRPSFNALAALEEQRKALAGKLGRLHRLLGAIDQTISHLKGEKQMTPKQLFAALTPEQENAYADEAAARWGEQAVRASQQKWARYSGSKKEAIRNEGEALYRDLIVAMPLGPDAPPVQACIARWRKHLGYFWTPNDEQCLGLATMYRDDPAFRKTYDAMHPDLAAFMCEAVAVYVTARRSRADGSRCM